MIRLTRVRTRQAIPAAFHGTKRVARIRKLVDGFRADSFDFQATVWKAAKKQLKTESAGKCAYCEAPTSVVAHGDVEHFRPKSVYWWLAYCYENYTYSCQICNQTYKGDQFPLSGKPMAPPGRFEAVAMLNPDPLEEAEGMAYAAFEFACSSERAHLVDVYREDPELFFKWEADPVLKAVRIAPRTKSSRSQLAARAAEAVLGLNREELTGLRWTIYEELATFRIALEALSPDSRAALRVRAQIREMMSDRGEFAGMVRYFARDQWRLEL